MNHELCMLLHYVAAYPKIEGFAHISDPWFMSLIVEAQRLRLIETKGPLGKLDFYWVCLSEKGRELVEESLCAMEAAS